MSTDVADIEVKIEAARGCGYRKKGGIYLVAPKPNAPCGRLPIPLDVCPCCHGGIKPTRAWTWVQPKPLFAAKPCSFVAPTALAGTRVLALESQLAAAGGRGVDLADEIDELKSGKNTRLQLLHQGCSLADENLPERAGLVWVGGKFYPNADSFMEEARRMGISRRIPAVPKDFVAGQTWVLLAHRECIKTAKPPAEQKPDDDEMFNYQAGIFTMFQPTAVEYVCHGTETNDEIAAICARGLKPVLVMNPGAPPTGGNNEDDDGD